MSANASPRGGRALITGATGFVGSRLHPLLTRTFDEVLCATRDVSRAEKTWPSRAWVHLDVTRAGALRAALEGIDVAYYLVHSMAGSRDYERVERAAAQSFAEAAASCGLSRIVYLGGVAPSGEASPHLRSRLATGEALRRGTVPCVELRAGMVIGSGSQSWQMVRDLSSRLPVMVLPRWLSSRSQPVSVRDVLAALAAASEIPDDDVGVYSLPGPEILTAKETLFRVARLRGYRPITVDVPLVTPRLSSYWIELVTRADRHVARELVEGLRADLVAQEPAFWKLMPDHELQTFDDAARVALEEDEVELSLRSRLLELAVKTVARRSR